VHHDVDTERSCVCIVNLRGIGISDRELTRAVPSHCGFAGTNVSKDDYRRIFVAFVWIACAYINVEEGIWTFRTGSAKTMETLDRVVAIRRSDYLKFGVVAIASSEVFERS